MRLITSIRKPAARAIGRSRADPVRLNAQPVSLKPPPGLLGLPGRGMDPEPGAGGVAATDACGSILAQRPARALSSEETTCWPVSIRAATSRIMTQAVGHARPGPMTRSH